ncbi:MAG TPA: hypothetical protein VIJ94_17635 [Caulobacteraceae bacterium]
MRPLQYWEALVHPEWLATLETSRLKIGTYPEAAGAIVEVAPSLIASVRSMTLRHTLAAESWIGTVAPAYKATATHWTNWQGRSIGSPLHRRIKASKRYDLIVCVGALQFVRDFATVFQRAGQLLRPAGQMLLTHEPLIEGHPDYGRGFFVSDVAHYRRSSQSVLDLSRRNGLKLRVLKDFVGGAGMGEPTICQLARVQRR